VATFLRLSSPGSCPPAVVISAADAGARSSYPWRACYPPCEQLLVAVVVVPGVCCLAVPRGGAVIRCRWCAPYWVELETERSQERGMQGHGGGENRRCWITSGNLKVLLCIITWKCQRGQLRGSRLSRDGRSVVARSLELLPAN
jgi:hypothetical protein